MKKQIPLLLLVLTLTGVTAFIVTDHVTDKLGLSQQTAEQYILNNIVGSFEHRPVNTGETADGNEVYQEMIRFKIPRAKFLPAVIQGDKAGVAKELCMYIKDYVNSKAFTEAYAKARTAAMPDSEPYRMDAATIATLKANVKEMEANLAKMKAAKLPANTIQQMEQGIATQKKAIGEQSDPTPNKTQWYKMYPENPGDAIKAKLQEYLAIAATVDFAATTTGSGTSKKFSNAAYEKKSLKWKAVYRAGKEVNTVVTAFINQWLKEGVIKN